MSETTIHLMDEEYEEIDDFIPPAHYNPIILIKEDFCGNDEFKIGYCDCMCRRGIVWRDIFPVEESLHQ